MYELGSPTFSTLETGSGILDAWFDAPSRPSSRPSPIRARWSKIKTLIRIVIGDLSAHAEGVLLTALDLVNS